uniref:Ubiquitin-like protease family profile domain-containing protein n=1 Tax=Panagrolaimus superbus TaxID=310955 RepID=A0A914Y030_9BILA
MSKRYKHKPTLSEFLSKQQVEFTMHDTRLKQLEANHDVKPRDIKYENLQYQLENYEAGYLNAYNSATTDAQRIGTMYTFIRKASYLLHDVRNKSGKTMKSQKRQAVDDLRKKANDSFVWKSDLNYSKLGPSFDIIDSIEKSLIAEGDDDNDFEMTENPFADDDFIPDESILSFKEIKNLTPPTDMNESLLEIDKTEDIAAHQSENVLLDLSSQLKTNTYVGDDGFIYNPGDDIPEKIHLDRLKGNQWLDDVIIMEYLMRFIKDDPRLILVDSISWRPDFVANSWGQQRRNHRLPTVPRYSDDWEFAIFPVNLDNNHWTLAILEKATSTITYFDPLHGAIPF